MSNTQPIIYFLWIFLLVITHTEHESYEFLSRKIFFSQMNARPLVIRLMVGHFTLQTWLTIAIAWPDPLKPETHSLWSIAERMVIVWNKYKHWRKKKFMKRNEALVLLSIRLSFSLRSFNNIFFLSVYSSHKQPNAFLNIFHSHIPCFTIALSKCFIM